MNSVSISTTTPTTKKSKKEEKKIPANSEKYCRRQKRKPEEVSVKREEYNHKREYTKIRGKHKSTQKRKNET